MPGLDQNGGEKTATIVASPRSTTCRGDSSLVQGAVLEGPSRMVVCVHEKL